MWRRQKFDVIVVGGGPAGSLAALHAARGGARVLLLEKDRDIGVPVRCGEAVSDAGLRIFFEPRERWIKATIRKIRLVSPSRHIVDFNLKEIGYILDRRVFDYDLAQFAVEAGATVVTKAYVSGVLKNGKGVQGVSGSFYGEPFEASARIVIGADGVESRVGRWAGFRTQLKMKDMESCIQRTVSGIAVDESRFDFYLSSRWAPGGYLWVFPKGPNSANIGLGVSGKFSKGNSARTLLDAFLAEYYPNASVIATTIGGVPVDKTMKEFVGDGILLAGDAAHMVNPVTGGGIVPAMRAGMLAGKTAAEAIAAGDVSRRFLQRYAEEWHGIGGKNHERFYRIKEATYTLTDDDLDGIALAVLSIPPADRTITKVFLKAIIKKPTMVGDVLRAFVGI